MVVAVASKQGGGTGGTRASCTEAFSSGPVKALADIGEYNWYLFRLVKLIKSAKAQKPRLREM
jgi:hypothetical protein